MFLKILTNCRKNKNILILKNKYLCFFFKNVYYVLENEFPINIVTTI